MAQRLTFGLGVATTLFAGAIGMLAPHAAAQELAPGVSCDGFTCHNDTDDTYRIQATATCSDGERVPVTKYVAPHVQSAQVDVVCLSTTEPGTWERGPRTLGPGTYEQQPPITKPDGSVEQRPPVFHPGQWEDGPDVFQPGRTIPNPVVDIRYDSAVVDNNPPAPSGSAGN